MRVLFLFPSYSKIKNTSPLHPNLVVFLCSLFPLGAGVQPNEAVSSAGPHQAAPSSASAHSTGFLSSRMSRHRKKEALHLLKSCSKMLYSVLEAIWISTNWYELSRSAYITSNNGEKTDN